MIISMASAWRFFWAERRKPGSTVKRMKSSPARLKVLSSSGEIWYFAAENGGHAILSREPASSAGQFNMVWMDPPRRNLMAGSARAVLASGAIKHAIPAAAPASMCRRETVKAVLAGEIVPFLAGIWLGLWKGCRCSQISKLRTNGARASWV